MISPDDFLFDINFYRETLAEPPVVTIEGDEPQVTVWLNDGGRPVVKVELNIGLRTVRIPSIVERTADKMHHRITIYGQESRSIETLANNVAEIAMQRWMHYKYWSVVNG